MGGEEWSFPASCSGHNLGWSGARVRGKPFIWEAITTSHCMKTMPIHEVSALEHVRSALHTWASMLHEKGRWALAQNCQKVTEKNNKNCNFMQKVARN